MQILIALFKEKHFILETCFISVVWKLSLKVWFKVSQSGAGFGSGICSAEQKRCVSEVRF